MKLIKNVFYYLLFLLVSIHTHSEEVIQGSDYYTKSLIIDNVEILIHYPPHKKQFKEKVENVIKSKISYFHHYFNYRPTSQIHIVINEFANNANGMATAFPYNIIKINDFPPQEYDYLNETDDWIRQLVVHEYVHILTIDMTRGYVDFFRNFFGSMVKTNGVMPAWMLEGVAVWAESIDGINGRANSEMVNFEVFLQLSDDLKCQDVSCLDFPENYPAGHARYWVGGVFLKYIESNKKNTLSCIFNEHSKSIPFLLNGIFEKCYGKDVEDSFNEFKKDFLAKNLRFKNFCPLNNSQLCKKLYDNKYLTKVNWQLGHCDDRVVIMPYPEGHNKSIAHKIYDISSNSFIESNYPIKRIHEIKNRCFVELFKFNGQIFENHFYELVNKNFKELKELKNSEIIAFRENELYPVNYLNGKWILKENENSYIVSDDINIKNISLTQEKVSYQNSMGKVQTKSLEKFISKKEIITDDEYNPFKYLKPNYLLVLFSNFANLNAMNVITGLSDPVGRHAFDFQFDIYENSEIPSPVPRFMAYQYNINQTIYAAGLTNLYSYSLFNNQINESSSYFFNYQKTINTFSSPNTFSMNVSKTILEDFISKRETLNFELGHMVSVINNKIDHWYNSYSVSTFINKTTLQGMDPFYGLRLGVNSSHNIGEFLQLSTDVKLSKYFKDDLIRGFYSAGGYSSFFTGSVNHQFFAVNQGDIFGNEITTARINLNYNLFDIYSGKGVIPFYLRNITLISGLEYAKAKFIAASKNIFIDEYAQSFYYGINVNSVFFYGVPTSIKFVMTNLITPTTSTGMILFFNAALF